MTDSKIADRPPRVSLYDRDIYAWAQEQAAAVRDRRFTDLDVANVAEELESLGIAQRVQIESRLRILLMHLLKWRYQPFRMSGSWRRTIREQRRRIEQRIEHSPSLRRLPEEGLDTAYAKARRDAAAETDMPIDSFPEMCPFTVDQVLDHDFWPTAAGKNQIDDRG